MICTHRGRTRFRLGALWVSERRSLAPRWLRRRYCARARHPHPHTATRRAMLDVPSTPYQYLPSAAPSRGGVGGASADAGQSGSLLGMFRVSPTSSTAALIQADCFTSARISAVALLRLRIFAMLWLMMGALLVPLCEYAGDSCALGVSRSDLTLGERGTLAGDGQPDPSMDRAPISAHARTLWAMSTLSYVLSLALLCYFSMLVLLSLKHSMLMKQCASYSYSALCVVSHASTAGHPLRFSMKFTALLFQLLVPTTIGAALIYFCVQLPYRRPLSWPISIHVHLMPALFATSELVLSRFLFRMKAMLWWCVGGMLYGLLLMITYIRTDQWVYSSLDWRSPHSLRLCVLTWVATPIFLGPLCFLLGACAQYVRDGCKRGMLTSAHDIGSRQSESFRMLSSSSFLSRQSNYIAGALASHAAANGDTSASPTPTTSHPQPFVSPSGFQTPTGTQAFQPVSSSSRHNSTSAAAGQQSAAGTTHPPPLLSWPLVNPSPVTSPASNRHTGSHHHSGHHSNGHSNGHHAAPKPRPATVPETGLSEDSTSDARATSQAGLWGKSVGWVKSWWTVPPVETLEG